MGTQMGWLIYSDLVGLAGVFVGDVMCLFRGLWVPRQVLSNLSWMDERNGFGGREKKGAALGGPMFKWCGHVRQFPGRWMTV